MASKFRENVNLWGTIIFGGLICYGAVTTAIDRFGGKSAPDEKLQKSSFLDGSGPKVSLDLSATEQDEVKRIKGAGVLAGQMGHQISPNTQLLLVTDNFGENAKCTILMTAQDPDNKAIPVHSKWNLVIQKGGGNDIVWTNNMMGPSAGEVRLNLGDSGPKYPLTTRVTGDGRGTPLTPGLLNDLLAAKTAKAISGLLNGSEMSYVYDLSSLQKAYKYANAICV